MTEAVRVKRRRQFCKRCGQLMFEYYCSPDGHFGLVDDLGRQGDPKHREFLCPVCGARYRLLEQLDATGQPLARF